MGSPLPRDTPSQPFPLLTWGEGAGGDRGSLEASGGDKSWGQKYTESWRGRVVTGNPPNMASLLGVGEKPDLFLL